MNAPLALAPASPAPTSADPRQQALPPRGFVLHVDLGPEEFSAAFEDVLTAADTLRELVHEWLPQARTRTAVTAAAPVEQSHRAQPAGTRRPAPPTTARRTLTPLRPPRPAPSGEPAAQPTRRPGPGGAPARSTASLRAALAALPDIPEVRIDLVAREVTAGGRPLRLTTKEFDLFAYLVRARGRVVGRDELHRTVWRDSELPATSRTVDVHVRRLRAVGELAGLVTTVHGVGYRVSPRPHVVVAG
jgi:hypothetical protein